MFGSHKTILEMTATALCLAMTSRETSHNTFLDHKNDDANRIYGSSSSSLSSQIAVSQQPGDILDVSLDKEAQRPMVKEASEVRIKEADEKNEEIEEKRRTSSFAMGSVIATLMEAFGGTDDAAQATSADAAHDDTFEPIACLSSERERTNIQSLLTTSIDRLKQSHSQPAIASPLGQAIALDESNSDNLLLNSTGISNAMQRSKGSTSGGRPGTSAVVSVPAFIHQMLPFKDRSSREPMPTGFNPGPYDIICGDRSKSTLDHVGNRRFRVTIGLNVDKYQRTVKKVDKTLIVIGIVDSIRANGGYFVKRDKQSGAWFDIGDQHAREKVGYALRDAINARSKKLKGAAIKSGTKTRNKQESVLPADNEDP